MRIGLVGLGRTGRALAKRMAATGLGFTMWSRTPGRALGLPGGREAHSLGDLLAASDIVLTSLADDATLKDVFDELLMPSAAGKLFIETSSVRPDTIQALAPRATAAGAALIDAPLLGGIAAIGRGDGVALVGGESAQLERARPLLMRFCRRIEHLGPVGTGMVMRLVATQPEAVYLQALAEGLALGRAHGLDLDRMLHIVADGPTPSGLVKHGAAIESDIAQSRQNLLIMSAACHQAGVPAPTATTALTGYTAANAAGWGDKDVAAIIQFWSEAMTGPHRRGE